MVTSSQDPALIDENGNPLGFEEKIDRVFKLQMARVSTSAPTSLKDRKAKLRKLRSLLLKRRPQIYEAFQKDMRKCPEEVDLTETAVIIGEISLAINSLKDWMKPTTMRTPLSLRGTKSYVHYEPKGVTLIMAPWNYPLSLTIAPLVSAIAAGCTAMLKPSEFTPHINAIIRDLISQMFEEDEVAIIEGDAHVAQALLKKPFHHIFFTGSPRVGKIVMKAASEHLSSVTLELGGKSPCIIDKSADVDAAALKVAWGKFINGGQTCVAPDYVYVHASQYEPFLNALRYHIQSLFGETEVNDSFTPVINGQHFKRLAKLLSDTVKSGAKVAYGGKADPENGIIPPTILTHVSLDSPAMQEEIFGPILPVLSYETLDDVYEVIEGRQRPLSLYVFSEDEAVTEDVMTKTVAGSTCINDTLIQYSNARLPFGGVNNSGIGKSHGHAGFIAFSNERAVMVQKKTHPALQKMYPPYDDKKRKLINLLLRYM